jgi:uncharacterized protein with GYD domain
VWEDALVLTFIIQGRHAQEAMRGMVASPEDRAEAAGTMMANAGGRLAAFYLTFGPYDFLCVCEAPNEETMAAVQAAVRASGSVIEHMTMLAIPGGRMKDILGRAGELGKSFRSAGQP